MFRNYADILTDLAKPIPQECVTKLKKGDTTIDYLHWYLVATVLDIYAPGWTSEPVEIRDMNGKVLVKMRLTIHATEGEFSQYATGCEEEGDGYGDAFTNACATALKRAAVLHGVGRDLYDKDQVLVKFRQHLGKQAAGHSNDTRPVKPAATKTRPASEHPEEHSAQWHDLYTRLTDACGENSFLMPRVTAWLKKTYGRNRKSWSTRDLTNQDLDAALTQVGARNFSDVQIRFLQAMPEPDAETIPTAAEVVGEP